MSSSSSKSHVPPGQEIGWGTWLCLLPILALPVLLTLRLFPMVAPNEEPKWAAFVIVGLIVSVGLTLRWLESNDSIRHPSPMMLAIVLFLLLLGVGILIAPNPIEGLLRWSFWLFGLFIALAGAELGRSQHPWIRQLTLWGLVLATLWFCWRYLWMYRFEYGAPGYNHMVLFSPIGHVNFTADVLILLIPWLAVMTLARNLWLGAIGWIGAVGCLVVLLIGASRGGLLGLGGGLTIAALIGGTGWWLRHRQGHPIAFGRDRALRWGALLTIPIVAWLIYEQAPYHYRTLDRVESTLEQATDVADSDAHPAQQQLQNPAPSTNNRPHAQPQINLPQQHEALLPPLAPVWDRLRPFLNDDRTGMYASALGMTLDAPWVGHGTGNFPFVYPAYSHRYPGYEDYLSSPTTYTTNPHNIFFQISTENGIPAALVFLGIWLGLIYRVGRSLFLHGGALALAGSSFAVGGLIDAMVNHVFYNPASLFVAMLLGGWLWGKTTPIKKAIEPACIPIPERFHPQIRRWGGYAVILGLFALAIWPTRWWLSERDVAFAMSYPTGTAEAALHYRQAYEWDPYNFRAVFGVGIVMAQEQRWTEAKTLIDYFVHIAPNNPQGWHILGSLDWQMGHLSEARAAFLHALELMPNYTPAKDHLEKLDAFMAAAQKQNAR